MDVRRDADDEGRIKKSAQAGKLIGREPPS